MALVAYSSYCYSEIINGTTANAATDNTWSMINVLPQLPEATGLTVNGVLYRYSVIKQTQDDMKVNIENKDALGNGLIFKQQDDWSGLPQNTITKVVPVPDVPIQRWGDGSISVEGQGLVVNPIVTYTYRYDTCFDPLRDPRCPGYAAAMAKFLEENGLLYQNTEVIDPLDQKEVQDALNNKTKLEEEADKKKREEKEKEKEERQRIGLEAAANTLSESLAISQETLIAAMNNVPNFTSYYTALNGGVYNDVALYNITTVPENKRGLRMGLAQQLLHNQLVDEQYKRK